MFILGVGSAARADMASVNQMVWKMKYGVTDAQLGNSAWLAADDDGDGITNGAELAAGTNPFSASKTIKVSDISKSGGSVTMQFPTEDGKRYRAESTNSISASAVWTLQPQPTPTVVAGDGTTKPIVLPYVANSYYRIRVDDMDSSGSGVSDWAKKILGYNINSLMTDGRTLDSDAIPAALALLNKVTVTATKTSATQPPDALTAPTEVGSVTVSRGLAKLGSLLAPNITVSLQSLGTALSGTDYDAISSSVAFDNQKVTNVVLTVNPRANSARRSNVTAIVKAQTGSGYTLGSASSASVVIFPAGVAGGTGLSGQYFNSSSSTYSPNQTNIFGGTPQMTRVDPTIDFNGIASITAGSPCTVTTVYSHGLANGTPVTISGVSGGTFSPAINGIFTATVTGANTFTVASNCTAIPSSLQIASVCGVNGITSVSTTGTPCTITTKVPHGMTGSPTVTISWLNGGTFSPSSPGINSTFTAAVTGPSTFTVPISCTATPSASQLSVATVAGPAGVNGWGATAGPVGMSAPATGGAWAVRWTGQVLPQYSETYTFDVRTNESAKLWVNGQPLIDRWATQTSVTEYANTITLKAGVLYDIQIDYWKSAPASGVGGNAEARLYWWSPSQPKQIIPQGRLFPAPTLAQKLTAITTALDAVGYVGTPFSLNISTPNIGATVTYALDANSGQFPPGLSLNAATGEISGSPTTAGTYNVAVNALNSAASGNVTGSSIINFTIYPSGSLTREILSGSTITADGTVASLDDDMDYPDNTSRRLRGYIVPPKTGNYYFWIDANSSAELWISNDSEYVNRIRRATVFRTASAAGKKTWNTSASQQTQWLSLVAGQKYYFEVLHNTGSGAVGADDYLAVGWCQDDIGTVPAVTGDANPNAATPLIPNGGGALQGYPLSGIAPSYIFQPYDYPPVTPSTGTLYAGNLGPQGSVITKASGSANLQINAGQTQAILHFSYQNLGSPRTNYHLHWDAFTSGDGVVHSSTTNNILFDIDDVDAFHPELRTADGGYVWNLTPAGTVTTVQQIRDAIAQGKIYLNVHSVTYPTGEIRGNLTRVDGSQTPPAAATYPDPSTTDSPSNAAHAARFLNQSTFGASPADVVYLATHTFSQWIDDQLAKPASHSSNDVVAGLTADINLPYPSSLFTNAWWKYSITGQDQLRQRLAFALSEILVVSWGNNTGPLQNNGRVLADYYDTLVDTCLPTSGVPDSGNFRGILKGVTLTPAMGLYLDLRGNQKEDLTIGRHPNENYAREIMQLFSVGLNRMWDDGRIVLNSKAELIPTYTQTSILGMAGLLTGWNYAQANQASGRLSSNFSPAADYLNAMALVPTQHDIVNPKLLLNGVVSPAATGLTPRVTLSNISVASPCVITTATAHGLRVGDTIRISNVSTSETAINGMQRVTEIVSATQFKVGINCTVAPTSYTNGAVTGATVIPATYTTSSGLAAVTGSQADNAGTTLPHPYDQYGQTELNRAIDNICDNDNVPPYVCRQLIQRLVTSHPSPGYVYRVVQKWRDNGSGVRGDLAAVVRQILLDGEARSYSAAAANAAFGKQREPVMRLTGPARAFPAASYTGTYTQLTGVNSNKLRIVTNSPNAFSAGFSMGLDFSGNYLPTGTRPNPSDVPTSTTYSVSATLGIAKTWTGITSISTGSPCPVVTSEPHGLLAGDTVRISGVTTGTYNGSTSTTFLSGTSRAVTVVDAVTFTIDGVNCTVAPTDAAASMKMVSSRCRVATLAPHGLTTGDSVTIGSVSGGSFTPTINATFPVTVVDASTFTIASNCTSPSTDNTGSIVGANTLDVTATGMTNATYVQIANSNILTVNTGGPATNAIVPGTTVSITSIAPGAIPATDPCVVITSAAHNLVSGGVVTIAGVTDGTFGSGINGTFVPTVTGANSFTFPVTCTVAPTDYSVANTTKLIRSRVYLKFLTQTTAGGAAIPADGIYDVLTNPTSSTFTVATGDTPATGRGGNTLLPKLSTSYTPLSSNTIVQFNTNVNHNMLVGQNVWVDVPVVGNPLTDAEYTLTETADEDHFKTSYLPASTNAGTYPKPAGSNNGITIYPLVPPPLGRSGTITINQSTFILGSTEGTLTQSPLNAPTVFNFFFPDYKFPGTLSNAGINSPEFQLSTDTNISNLTNSITNMVIGTGGGNSNLNGLYSFNNGGGSVVMDIGSYMTIAKTSNAGIPALVDELASLLVGASLISATVSPAITNTRDEIISFVASSTNFPMTSPTPTNQQMRDRVRAIIHLITTSAEYSVQK